MKVIEGDFGKKEVATVEELIEVLHEEDMSVFSDMVVILQGPEVTTIISNTNKGDANIMLDRAKLNLIASEDE